MHRLGMAVEAVLFREDASKVAAVNHPEARF